MAPVTPYSGDLADREPLAAMRDTADKIGAIVSGWTPEQFERTYAPGKWTARQILIHLAQSELALGTRARMALSTPDYAAQSFDQDAWMAIEAPARPKPGVGAGRAGGALGGREAAEALLAANAMNRALFTALSDGDRAIRFSHPEYGALTVDWIIHQMAGHLIHHLVQLEMIAGS